MKHLEFYRRNNAIQFRRKSSPADTQGSSLHRVAICERSEVHNMLIGFSGMLLAVYTEAKQNNDAATLATSKKLAGMLIEMVLKTDPENLRIENGQIVMK